jgi:hypothetical protein
LARSPSTSGPATLRAWRPADRLLATTLHQRLALPQVAIAVLFSVRPETINKRVRDVRQLLAPTEHTIQPAPHRLADLDDLYSLATAAEITLPSKDQDSVLIICKLLTTRHWD